jgi:hypothetical protein
MTIEDRLKTEILNINIYGRNVKLGRNAPSVDTIHFIGKKI